MPRRFVIAPIGVLLCAAAVFINSIAGEFACDDVPQIRDNPAIRSLSSAPQYFAAGVWASTSIKSKDQFLYRPFFLLYLSANFLLWGVNPAGYHVVSLLLHALNSLLVYALIRAVLQRDDWLPPFSGALWFAVHPVHSESVSWISAVPDLLATLFGLLSLLFHVRRRRIGNVLGPALSVACFICAVLAKEAAIVLPAIIIAYDATIERRLSLSRSAAYVAAAAAYVAVRTAVLGKTTGTLEWSLAGLGLMGQLVALYIKSILIPWPPGIKFDMPVPGVSVTAGMLAVGCAVAWYASRRRPLVFALLWIVIALFPPLSLAFHWQPTYAERFMYLPSVGCALLAAGVVADIEQRWRRAAVILTVVLAVVWGAVTVASNRTWSNDQHFYLRAIANSPAHFGAYEGLALSYVNMGLPDRAIDTYLAAIEQVAADDRARAFGNVALLYGQRGDTERSIQYFRQQLALNPQSSSAMVGLGNNYWAMKEYSKALEYYSRAFAVDPTNYEACFNLALLYDRMGERDRALYHYRAFASSAPVETYAEAIRTAQRKIQEYAGAAVPSQ